MSVEIPTDIVPIEETPDSTFIPDTPLSPSFETTTQLFSEPIPEVVLEPNVAISIPVQIDKPDPAISRQYGPQYDYGELKDTRDPSLKRRQAW